MSFPRSISDHAPILLDIGGMRRDKHSLGLKISGWKRKGSKT